MRHAILPLLLMGCSPSPPVAHTGWEDIGPSHLQAVVSVGSGRHKIVNFWATWCGPCLAEIPVLTGYATSHPDIDLVFVSIDHPSVRSRGQRALDDVGLGEQRVLHLGEVDASDILRRTVPGWTDAIPLTLVVGPSGERLATFPYAINADMLDSALVTP